MKPWKKYLIEFLVIVGGILSAIQLENWNQENKDREKESLILQELHEEFVNNKNQLKKVVSIHKKISSNCNKLMQLFPIDLKKVDRDSLKKFIRSTYTSWTFNPSQGTINSLINSTTFDIITNDSLRKIIISWNDIVNDYTEEESNSSLYYNNIYTKELMKNIPAPFNWNDHRANYAFLSSMEFENLVRRRQTKMLSILGIFNNDNELVKIQNTIDDIIRLTKLEDKR